MDLMYFPSIANAEFVKNMGKKAVFTVKALEEYKIQSGKNIGQTIPCLLLEHESKKLTRLSLSTAQHLKDLNRYGFTSIKTLKGCRLVLEIQKVMAFGKEVDAVRIQSILGKDSIEVPITKEEDDPDEPTADELLDMYDILDE
jgi:hypothetical protein